jgi:hypothetical protein
MARGAFSEAETALLDALHDLHAMPFPPRRDVTATATRLIHLYEAWGTPDRATPYRVLLTS